MEDLLFTFFLLVNTLTVALLSRQAKALPTGIRKSATNPFLWVSLLLALFAVDFVVLWFDPTIDIYEEFIYITKVDIVIGFGFFTACAFGLFIGSHLSLRRLPKRIGHSVRPAHDRTEARARTITFLTIVILCALLTAPLIQSLGDILAGESTRQLFFRDNQLAYIAISTLPASLALFASRSENKLGQFLLGASAVGLITLLSGSRGSLILLALIFLYSANYSKTVTPKWLIAPAILLGSLFLVITRFIFRESFRYNSVFDFIADKGGVFATFFKTSEISLAESLTAVMKFSDVLHRYPFESVFAALTYPIPRAIFPSKPLGGDAYVTSVLSPQRWEASRSELTITGFADLFLQFGLLTSVAICGVIGFYWTRAVLLVNRDFRGGVFMTPLLMWWIYIFIRSGVFNSATIIWGAIICLSLLSGVRLLTKKVSN